MFHNFFGLLEYYLNLDSTHVKIDESQKKKLSPRNTKSTDVTSSSLKSTSGIRD